MAKVITFSRTFPGYHPKAGEPTYFVEKIWESLIQTEQISTSKCCELSRLTGIGGYDMNNIRTIKVEPKHHTIRAGQRFKVGDKFSPRVWSGKPYASKQIIIAPDIEVKATFNFEIQVDQDYVSIGIDDWLFYEENARFITQHEALKCLAQNDGLSVADFKAWFKWPSEFRGQIICWNDKIEY